jgi:hypothetical protein
VPFRRLTVARLADAIRQAVDCPETRRRAAWLGARLREEDGVGRAVAALHDCLPVLQRQWGRRPEPAPFAFRPARALLPEGAARVG